MLGFLKRKKKDGKKSAPKSRHTLLYGLLAAAVCAGVIYLLATVDVSPIKVAGQAVADTIAPPPMLDRVAYDLKLLQLVHISTSTLARLVPQPLGTSTLALSSFTPQSLASSSIKRWPTRAPYPNYGAILPFSRIVAYYGNFYSTGMGVLGETPPPQMLQALLATAAQWQAADPTTPVIPAIDYIAVVAQGSAGADGKYRARMPDSQIQEAISLANQVHGLVILDVQVGLSNLQTEVPLLAQYLELPNVELAVDPEFAMHNGSPPGTVIGSLDASDINYAAQFLATLVRQYHLPPKILVVHRFTEEMVTNVPQIKPLPEVEVVMDMDGWGAPSRKIGTYQAFVYGEPVQFTGFKLFYKNDLKPPSTGVMTPAQVLGLTPAPLFIQYQ